jgi:hypothetical protein
LPEAVLGARAAVSRGMACHDRVTKLMTCSGLFEPIIPGGRLGWGGVDVAA